MHHTERVYIALSRDTRGQRTVTQHSLALSRVCFSFFQSAGRPATRARARRNQQSRRAYAFERQRLSILAVAKHIRHSQHSLYRIQGPDLGLVAARERERESESLKRTHRVAPRPRRARRFCACRHSRSCGPRRTRARRARPCRSSPEAGRRATTPRLAPTRRDRARPRRCAGLATGPRSRPCTYTNTRAGAHSRTPQGPLRLALNAHRARARTLTSVRSHTRGALTRSRSRCSRRSTRARTSLPRQVSDRRPVGSRSRFDTVDTVPSAARGSSVSCAFVEDAPPQRRREAAPVSCVLPSKKCGVSSSMVVSWS